MASPSSVLLALLGVAFVACAAGQSGAAAAATVSGGATGRGLGANRLNLTGASVTGNLVRNGNNNNNFFNPTAGFVPAGYGNSAPNNQFNVAVRDTSPVVEFGVERENTAISVDVTTAGKINVKVAAGAGLAWNSLLIVLTSTTFIGIDIKVLGSTPRSPFQPRAFHEVDFVAFEFPPKKASDTFSYTFTVVLYDGCHGPCCEADGSFTVSGTTCRPVAGGCDVPETCTGKTGQCPEDKLVAKDVECRAATGDCDVAEVCTGRSASCPKDRFAPKTKECRASTNLCDAPEFCPGDKDECPTDKVAPKTTICRKSTGPCDLADFCNGTDMTCTDDAKIADGKKCHTVQAGGPLKRMYKHCHGRCEAGECALSEPELCPASAPAPAPAPVPAPAPAI